MLVDVTAAPGLRFDGRDWKEEFLDCKVGGDGDDLAGATETEGTV